jgi:nicotinate-nucleotide adenylyltransferase
MSRIGVFGGTFDPIHWGHLVLAEEARLAARLDRVLFVPSGLPPHKARRLLTPIRHRLEMVRRAVSGIGGFEVSDVEADGDGPHYTLDTLERLAHRHPGEEISFILGSDSLLELSTWHRPEAIVAAHPLVVLARPGFDPSSADPRFRRDLTVVDTVSVALSSTLVRKRIASGQSVRLLVPGPVLEYAREHRLYEAGEQKP